MYFSLVSFVLVGLISVLYSTSNLQPARTWDELIAEMADRTLTFSVLYYITVQGTPAVSSANPV